MRAYPHTAVVAAMLHDETRGEVSADRHGRPKCATSCRATMRRRCGAACMPRRRSCLAAGAKQVMVPLGTPLIARTTAELAPLLAPPSTGRSIRCSPRVHPMGSLPLGSDPRRAVVDPQGRHHQLRGLYVADGSVFPTSLGGPPQLSIYATGRRVARTVCADLQSAASADRQEPAPWVGYGCSAGVLLSGCAAWHDLFQRDRAQCRAPSPDAAAAGPGAHRCRHCARLSGRRRRHPF